MYQNVRVAERQVEPFQKKSVASPSPFSDTGASQLSATPIGKGENLAKPLPDLRLASVWLSDYGKVCDNPSAI